MLFWAQKRGQNTPRMSLRVHFSLLYCPKMVPNGPKMAPQASLSTLGSCSGSLNRIWVFWGPKKGPKQTQNSTRAIFRAQTVQILKWGPKNPSKIAPNGPKWLPIVSTSPAGSYTLPQYMIKVLWDPKKGPKHTQNGPRKILRVPFFLLYRP